jgi:hypothetical protein
VTRLPAATGPLALRRSDAARTLGMSLTSFEEHVSPTCGSSAKADSESSRWVSSSGG